MQIDPRTMSQYIQLQTMNGMNLDGTSVQGSSSDTNGSLFDILLQEMLLSEQGKTSSDLGSRLTGSLSAGSDLSGSLDSMLLQTLQDVPKISTAAEVKNPEVAAGTTGGLESLISKASQAYSVPTSLIKAVIDTESSFNPQAVSSAGAKGLMQLMDGTARGLGLSDAFDPAQNIDGGTRYLSYQLKRYGGELKTALAAYNAGPGRLQKLGISNDQELMDKLHLLPQETQKYIGKILTALSKYEA
ncbi:lytic transglycosylase domain-containing protein [Paenibacillus puldeungensis]|uniref:Lytic transglycosylase domain-containing protein n=1 Tax=Paenibacillus puldeungensis TaxID=696536 RepID=A0ABW3RUU4_9BACL